MIWRYIDFWKFEDLLKTGKLFMTRLKVFEDRYEGSNPLFVPNIMREAFVAQGGKVEEFERQQRLQAEIVTTMTLASSWHEENHECDPMWRLYCHHGEGVAIESTMGRLRAALPAFPRYEVRRVTYLNYNEDINFSRNPLGAAFFKRREFLHEREVRVAHVEWPGKEELRPHSVAPDGDHVEVQLQTLIRRAVVSPHSEGLFDRVQSLIAACDLTIDLAKSTLTQARGY